MIKFYSNHEGVIHYPLNNGVNIIPSNENIVKSLLSCHRTGDMFKYNDKNGLILNITLSNHGSLLKVELKI